MTSALWCRTQRTFRVLFCFSTAELQVIVQLMGVGDYFIQNFCDVQPTSKTEKQNHRGWNFKWTLSKWDLCQAKMSNCLIQSSPTFIITLFFDATNPLIQLIWKAQILQMPLSHKSKGILKGQSPFLVIFKPSYQDENLSNCLKGEARWGK